jgi:hypothetical protein
MQEDEVTEELLTFHEAVKHMQDEEEALMDFHCQLTDVSCLSLVTYTWPIKPRITMWL